MELMLADEENAHKRIELGLGSIGVATAPYVGELGKQILAELY